MEPEIEVTPTKARSGVKLGIMRYVLGLSLAGVVIAFVVTYFFS